MSEGKSNAYFPVQSSVLFEIFVARRVQRSGSCWKGRKKYVGFSFTQVGIFQVLVSRLKQGSQLIVEKGKSTTILFFTQFGIFPVLVSMVE